MSGNCHPAHPFWKSRHVRIEDRKNRFYWSSRLRFWSYKYLSFCFLYACMKVQEIQYRSKKYFTAEIAEHAEII